MKNKQIWLLVLVVFAVYGNTLWNNFCYDDTVVFTQNNFVQQGIHGIPALLTSEYFAGYTQSTGMLAGARYRPLVLVSFALEKQFFGTNPHISHLINVLLFACLMVLLYRVLKQICLNPLYAHLPVVTCLFFIVHPIHTEVVANVKGRDELLASIALLASFSLFLSNLKEAKKRNLFLSLLCFSLAMLTKETSIMFAFIFPLSLYFFFQYSPVNALKHSITYFLVLVIFVFVRTIAFGGVSTFVADIGNSPYMFATPMQAFATKLYVIFLYLKQLILPLHLSYEYGYNQIPYISLYSPQFALGMITSTAFIIACLLGWKKRHPSAFVAAFFILTLLLGTNLCVDLGAIMADRMLFQPSLIMALLFAWIWHLPKQKQPMGYLFKSLLLGVGLGYALLTFQRNTVWKDNLTLFLTDVQTVPNSIRANQNAALACMVQAKAVSTDSLAVPWMMKGIQFHQRALSILPDNQFEINAVDSSYVALIQKAGSYEQIKPLLTQLSAVGTKHQLLVYLNRLCTHMSNGLEEEGRTNEALFFKHIASQMHENNN